MLVYWDALQVFVISYVVSDAVKMEKMEIAWRLNSPLTCNFTLIFMFLKV